MTAKEKFLTNQQRYQPLMLPQHFSDEEMVRDWTLNGRDCQSVNRYRKPYFRKTKGVWALPYNSVPCASMADF